MLHPALGSVVVLVAFTTVVRGAPLDRSGEVVLLDWDSATVVARSPIGPSGISHDPNPRGNTRGGRGIEVVDGHLVVASFNALHVLDRSLRLVGVLRHRLMLGLHELDYSDGQLWLSATNLDAALRVDPHSGQVTELLCARDLPAVQRRWSIRPVNLQFDHPDLEHLTHPDSARDPSHLHLNAVSAASGRVVGLLNRHGAIVDLRTGELLIEDAALRGGHNLMFTGPHRVTVADTVGRAIRTYELGSGHQVGATDILQHRWARSVALRHDWRFKVRDALRRFGLPTPPYRALFVRGLEPVPGSNGREAIVGVSPAALLHVDLHRQLVTRVWEWSRDVRCCIHGVRVVEP